jgi:hypothetical protein
MLSYEQANRWADPSKPQISPLGVAFHYAWRFAVVASRVMTLAVFATAFQAELLLIWGLHWLLMVLWILMMVRKYNH